MKSRVTSSIAASVLLFLSDPLVSSTSYAAGDAGPKDHSLFVGQDVKVLVNGEYQPVIGAGRRSFVVEDNHRAREIYTNKAKSVRVTRGLKPSTLSASITSLNVTSSSDQETRAGLESMQNAIAIANDGQDRADYAQGHLVRAEWIASLGGAGFGASQQQNADARSAAVETADSVNIPKMLEGFVTRDRAKDQGDDRLLDAVARPANSGDGVQLLPEITPSGVRLSVSGGVSVTAPTAGRGAAPATTPGRADEPAVAGPTTDAAPTVNPPAPEHRTIHDLADGKSDRLDFEFALSSPRPLTDAYVIITTEYVSPGQAEPTRRVLAQTVGAVGSVPRKIRLYETGYPTGFHVNRYDISLYAAGQEVATNLSPDRLEMSSDEAYEYLVVEYLSSHKGATLPPAAVLMAPRTELLALANRPEFTTPVYVTVDSDGRIQTLSADSAGKKQVPTDVQSALEKFRFIPALDKGVPVAGRAKLVVADFTH